MLASTNVRPLNDLGEEVDQMAISEFTSSGLLPSQKHREGGRELLGFIVLLKKTILGVKSALGTLIFYLC